MIDPRNNRQDFTDLVRIAADQIDATNPLIYAILEKDYWVTRVLCAAANAFPNDVLLKGGTSLSKAFGLTRRLSEDVDLVVLPGDRGESRRDKLLKGIAEAVRTETGLTEVVASSSTGVHRDLRYSYEPIWSEAEAIAPSVLLEMGTRSGTAPAEQRTVQTLIAEEQPAAVGELPQTTVSVLAARRTLIEKLFAVHAKVSRFAEDNKVSHLTRIGRHYYDLGILLRVDALRATVGTEEFWSIARDVDDRGSAGFATHRAPANLDFAQSPALFPTDNIAQEVANAYKNDEPLFLGEIPDLPKTMALFEDIRNRLTPPDS